MHNSDFEGPDFYWSMLSIMGAIATAILLIFGLEMWATQIRLTHRESSNSSQTSPQLALEE